MTRPRHSDKDIPVHCFVFGSNTFGGHEMMAAQMVRALTDAGRPVRVLARPESLERLRAICGDSNVEFAALAHGEARFESLSGYLNPRVYVAALELLRKTAGCQTIVAVNGGLTANHALTLALILVQAMSGRRVIVYYPMLHSHGELSLSTVRALGYRAAQRRVVRRVDHFLTIDAIWRARLAQRSSRKLDIAVVHNWVDRGRFRLPGDRSQRTSDGELKICFVGRLDKFQKGLDLFLDVAAALASEPAPMPVQFGIIGDGPFDAELRRRCRLIENDRVRFVFHGWQKEPARLMEAHDALILPSRLEGVPTVVLEALEVGLRVFAFDIPAMRILVQPDWLVPAFDTAAMAARIRDFAENRDSSPRVRNPYVEMIFDGQRFAAEVQRALCP